MKTQFVLFTAGTLGMLADLTGSVSLYLTDCRRILLHGYFSDASKPVEQRTN